MTDPTDLFAQYRALGLKQCESCLVLAVVMRDAIHHLDVALDDFIVTTVATIDDDDMPWDPDDILSRVEYMRASLRAAMEDVLRRVPDNPAYDAMAKDRAC